MSTVTISKKEYQELTEHKLRYEYLRRVLEENLFSPPPTKAGKEIVSALNATGLYNKKFLASIQKGLKRSSHFRNK
jgi:hypothetical protein